MHENCKNDDRLNTEWNDFFKTLQRNPDILLYGLPWAFPGWIGNGTRDPYHNPPLTADYIVKWIEGAKQVHNLTIDFVGVCFFLP